MARISLRAYQREIEELVETHQFDQAIAHCRHILRYYPKDINTYRLLGKAYLESQRYGDASDIFIRVLSTVPDDFVSHVGMSIIREDEGNLDEAIWHMQRAFETQPANSAIQGELRRLHGRREGIEPPKIRLTRGALARMYLKGELYAQALTELRAGLQEDPKRFDLQVVLAQAYYLAGQRVDAVDASSTLLKSLPFCLEANKILAEILSHSERADEAQVYIKRVQSLDPYMAHLSPTVSAPEKVAESAILLEKLEWRPGLRPADTIQQPEWATSLGVDLGTVTGADSMPDWLAVSGTGDDHGGTETGESLEKEPTASEEETPVVNENEAVPDWMKDAGWMESQETGNQAEFLPLSETEGIEPDLAPADIPEWLKTMAPAEVTDEASLPIPPLEPLPVESAEDAQAAVLPWLDETPPGPTDSVAMWLENQEPAANLDDQIDLGATNIETIPDWLQDLGEPVSTEKTLEEPLPQTMQPEENLPTEFDKEGISNLGIVAGITAAAGLLDADRQDEEPPEEMPTEMAEELQSEAVMQAGIADWLQELGSVDAEPAVEPAFMEAPIDAAPASLDEPLAQADIPEWIQNLEPVTDVQTAQQQPTDSSVLEEPLEQGVPAAGVDVQTSDWVPDIGEQVTPQESPPYTVETPTPAEPQSLEDDEAFAWLENLAARQGAEEALLLSPDERRETPPEWILSETEEERTEEPQKDLAAEIAGAVILATAISDDTTEVREETPADEIISSSPAEQEQPDTEGMVLLPATEVPIDVAVAEAELAGDDLEAVAEIPAEPPLQVSAAEAGSEEMLFYPLETAEADEQPISLDEGPIAEEDTKPRAIKTEAVDTVEAIAVAAGVIGAMASTDKEPVLVPLAGEQETLASAPELEEEIPQLVEVSEIGDELPVSDHEPEKPIAEGVVIPEEDEAFAWLESLAARQGADEALLLAPEERLESPPEWVVQEAAEAEEEISDEALGEAELPEWLQEAPEAAQEAQETDLAAEKDTGVPDWLIAPAAIVAETIEEQRIESEASTPLAPELPTWLEGIEDSQKEMEATSWTPSEESFDVMEAETSQELPELVPETTLEPMPAPALDLNKAGLVELERIPGVGFIKAQAILDYRDKHGPFREVDELLLVAGITPEVLLELKQHLSVGETEAAVVQETPAEDHQILLVQARNALVQGDIPLAISRYGILIDKKQLLPEVITDLNEALYRFPIDVSIWESLGDAHMHAGHLQDALNAYTKAEEYLH